jgi:hypothetical protein
VPLVEQELLTLPEHLSSPPVFSGVRVTRSLVLFVCFVYRCLSFCTFSFGHCVVCSSSIYGFWLPLWYLQTLLPTTCWRLSVFDTRSRTILWIGALVLCKWRPSWSIEIRIMRVQSLTDCNRELKKTQFNKNQ